jgi:hypothetical protein
MGIENRGYADPTFGASRELGLGRITPTVSGAADEVVAQHRFFTAVKVLEARACVKVIGKADTSGYNVYKGTASIGKILLGTTAAASVIDATLTDTDFAATDDLYLKNIVATDTCSAFIALEYQERFA